MNVESEITTRVKAAVGELHVQLIAVQVNLEAALARIKELEAATKTDP